jgi:hypothetical protein
MTELERLKARRQSWLDAKAPYWILKSRARVVAELDAKIARLETIATESKEDEAG